MKLSKPILFFHCVDNRNINAQSNNTKAILAGWDSKEFPAEALYFHDPDPAVAANPNVRLHRMPRNRLWKAYALKLIARKYSAVVYPGLSAVYDDRLRYLRKFIGNNDTVITTLEGLPGNAEEEDKENVRLSRMAGHRAYCQGINPTNMRAIDSMKSNADLVVAISPFLERMAAQMWPGRATAQVPLGVNLDCFNSKGRVPHGQNLRVRVVAAGSFQLRKRPELFLDLARAHPEADFTWYGEPQFTWPGECQGARASLSTGGCLHVTRGFGRRAKGHAGSRSLRTSGGMHELLRTVFCRAWRERLSGYR
jgi:hypothetical protein